MDDSRAVTPVVGKALEASIVVLYIGVVTAALYGGVVPDYRTAVGDEVGDRTLSKTVQRVQQAVPPNATDASVRTRVTLPETIRGHRYAIRTSGETLVLDHPLDRVSDRARLALPETVSSVSGNWSSADETVVVVSDTPAGLAVRLESGGER